MNIEVFGDIACPWCYVGERRLTRALAERPTITVERVWRPFQLQPAMPKEGAAWPEFARTKFGGDTGAAAMYAHMRQIGTPEGIAFDFERMPTAPNTLDAHRLVLYAVEQGKEWMIVDALFAAYFTEGRDVGDRDTLVAIAAGLEMDAGLVSDYLASDANADAVAESQATAQALNITGVPFYIFDGRYALSGAQPLRVFLRALDLAAEAPAVS